MDEIINPGDDTIEDASSAELQRVLGAQGRVVHVKDAVPNAVYIGRKTWQGRRMLREESPFHNPFRIGQHWPGGPQHQGKFRYDRYLTRPEVIELYSAHLRSRPDLLRMLPELRGKVLACWCRHDGEERTPQTLCHGDLILTFLQAYTDEQLIVMAAGIEQG